MIPESLTVNTVAELLMEGSLGKHFRGATMARYGQLWKDCWTLRCESSGQVDSTPHSGFASSLWELITVLGENKHQGEMARNIPYALQAVGKEEVPPVWDLLRLYYC